MNVTNETNEANKTIATRLILVRHAEAEGNVKRIFHAQLAAESLKNVEIDILYSSSLKRTLTTAGYISKVKQLPIIRTDKLKEINGGDWEDVAWELLSKKWPEAYDSWENNPYLHQMPNGESMKEFQLRLVNEINHIVNDNKEKNICIVTHGTAIRVLTCYFHHNSLEEINCIKWVDNTSITTVDYKDGIFHVVNEGDTSHLTQNMKTLENQDWWIEKMSELNERESDNIGCNE